MPIGRLRKLGSKGGPEGSEPGSAKGGAMRLATASLRQSPPPVAVDFGVGSLRALQVSGANPPALVAAATIDVPEELQEDAARRLQFQIEALPKLIRKGGFRSTRAVASIPSSAMFCKHLQVPRTDGVDRNEVVRAAVGKQLGVDPSTLLCRHVPVRELGSGKHEVICFATSREVVGSLMGALKSSRLEPVGIHSEIEALVQACPAPGSEGEGATLYLDMGRGTTKVVIARGTELMFGRVVEFGSRRLDEAVARQLKVTPARAAERRRALERVVPERVEASPEPEAAAEVEGEGPRLTREAVRVVAPEVDLGEELEILTDEVSMCLRYHRSLFADDPVRRVVFVGGEARNRATCEHVARMLRLSASTGDPIARVARTGKEPTTGVTMTEPQPGWAVALGMCLSRTDL